MKHLTHYIKNNYLQMFKRGGFHVLYSLPTFDATKPHIDYSIISKRALSVDKLHGVEIESINEYLRRSWLQSATYIDEQGQTSDYELMGKLLLAKHNTQWTGNADDVEFQMYFGPLQIRALCEREVLLTMDLQELEAESHFS